MMEGNNGFPRFRKMSETARTFFGGRERHIATARTPQGRIIVLNADDMESFQGYMETARTGRKGEGLDCKCTCHLERSCVSVFPRVANFSPQGGASKHQITNDSKSRLAVKIKCSDNMLYKVNPVYSFLDPGYTSQLEVLLKSPKITFKIARLPGETKRDKLVVMYLETTDKASDPKIVFDVNPKKPQQAVIALNVI